MKQDDPRGESAGEGPLAMAPDCSTAENPTALRVLARRRDEIQT